MTGFGIVVVTDSVVLSPGQMILSVVLAVTEGSAQWITCTEAESLHPVELAVPVTVYVVVVVGEAITVVPVEAFSVDEGDQL